MDEVLNKAYRLAHFIHPDRGTAIKIVAAAMLKLDVAMAAQNKRLYYIPTGRFLRGESRRTGGIRNKASFGNLHLLQRLVYIESEHYERQKEQEAVSDGERKVSAGTLCEDDLIVYFIKHLARITIRRNAFYVTLGLCRLLHNYSTVETMEIYNAVIGEPERVKDDYYYRSRKGVLMQEMKQRFGSLIRVCRRQRGEERFEAQQCAARHQSLVAECLRLFTPWDTRCPVPPDFNPLTTVIARLTSKSGVDEDKVEVERIHAVLHPVCFGRLVAGLSYAHPGERLEVPSFFFSRANDQEPPPRTPTDLSAEELIEIKNSLAKQAGRRRRTTPALMMRVMVDGVERAVLDPVRRSSLRFSVAEDAELIEIRTAETDGDLLLATHLLTSRQGSERDRPATSSIVLESGKKLSLRVAPRQGPADEAAGLQVDFRCEETNPLRAAQLFLQRQRFRLSERQGFVDSQSPGDRKVSATRIFAFACVLLLVCGVAGYLGYVSLGPRPVERSPEISGTGAVPPSGQSGLTPDMRDREGRDASPAGEASPAPNVVAQGGRRAASEFKRQASTRPSPARTRRLRQEQGGTAVEERYTVNNNSPNERDEAPTADPTPVTDVTRSSGVQAPGLSLSEVGKVYIDLRDDGLFGQQLRRDLTQGLLASGLLTVAASGDEADASLKITTVPDRTRDSKGGQIVVARLVNARGEVLWPKANSVSRGRYTGAATKISSELVRDLLAEIIGARTQPR